VRDVDFLIAMGFQTWSRGFTPRDIVGYWLPRAVDVDIRIGDVIVAPGDYLLGDRDGLLRVPQGDRRRRAGEGRSSRHHREQGAHRDPGGNVIRSRRI
jgi:regulator of RNase E activity RraA